MVMDKNHNGQQSPDRQLKRYWHVTAEQINGVSTLRFRSEAEIQSLSANANCAYPQTVRGTNGSFG
jgi:hypothetical protein